MNEGGRRAAERDERGKPKPSFSYSQPFQILFEVPYLGTAVGETAPSLDSQCLHGLEAGTGISQGLIEGSSQWFGAQLHKNKPMMRAVHVVKAGTFNGLEFGLSMKNLCHLDRVLGQGHFAWIILFFWGGGFLCFVY